MQLVDKEHYREYPPLNRLGQEPMDASFDYIYPRIHQSHLPIKRLLLDQSIFTGIGNIYANEICFRMGMDPRTRGDRLSKKRIL
ncbi:DNA-formamidopyrimidine glycosylase, partial [Tyzzerella nexilis]|nr:DNA-formamidopyrimidine glycosylase [[Clostridium] nexile]